MADNPRLTESGSGLGRRVGLSAIVIPSLIFIFYADARIGERAFVLLALCMALALRCVWELVAMLRVRSFAPNFALTAIVTVWIVSASWQQFILPPELRTPGNGLEPAFIHYAFSVLILLLSGAIRFREPGKSMETLGVELLIVSYVGVLLSVTAQLRWVAGGDAGYLVLGSLVVAAKCGDIGAYTLGRLFGRRKLAPRLSPGKTWMGALGALLGAGFGGWAWLRFGTPLFNASWTPCGAVSAVLYGVAIGLAGLVGDLCESLMKRDVGRKDAANLLPGFGGLLDLLDSILYAGPLAYVLWQVMPLATWR